MATASANAGRKALMACLLPAVRRELSRRQQVAEQNDPREILIAKLDEMAERLRADPNWREPTAEEQEAATVEVMAWFRENGYLEEDGKHLKPPRREY
jgi:hypothetical protein